jgi:predicted enzyme related to lactoylglutathione lyase
MSVTFKNVVIFVTDLAKAKKFYGEQLGLPVAGESEMMIEFLPGAPTSFGVALALHEDARKLVGRHTGITLKAERIVELCATLTAAGVYFVEPLESSPWGRMAVIADPDGNQLALVDR